MSGTNSSQEAARIDRLHQLCLLDTPPEPAFENLVDLAKSLSDSPFAVISLVDSERQWFKANRGIAVPQTARTISFCTYTIESETPLWVEDARLDPRFLDSPLVVGEPWLRFYCGAPIRLADGVCIGAVAVMSDKPRAFNRRLADQLAMVAQVVADECARRESRAAAATAVRQGEADRLTKQRFLTNISHEIKTPLNGILGAVSLLDRQALSLDQARLIEIVAESSRSLTRVLDDVLNIAEIETGAAGLQFELFRLDELIAEVADRYRDQATAKGLALVADVVDETRYLGDPAHIRQILCGLVSNAVRFTETGSILITVSVRSIAGGDRVRISVADTGPGFDPATTEKVFAPFEQGDGSLTRRIGGSGLGLAIARGLAESMGGSLDASSAPGKGACFTLRLDLQSTSDTAAAEPVQVEFSDLPDRVAGARVLVAEDHPTNRAIAAAILGSAGIEAHLVEDGAQAVAAFGVQAFDLILMDVQMPVMDGLEAIRQIRVIEALDGRGHTPIYTLSAHSTAQHIQDALAAGADDHLAKPITCGLLIEAVTRALAVEADPFVISVPSSRVA